MSFPTPAARIGLFVGQAAVGSGIANLPPMPDFFTDEAWAVLDNTFRYALLGPDAFGVPGDENRDDVTNRDDFDIISMNMGMTPAVRTDGDLNFDETVGLVDFRIWKRKDGATAAISAGARVPEPAALLLACFPLVAGCTLRPRG